MAKRTTPNADELAPELAAELGRVEAELEAELARAAAEAEPLLTPNYPPPPWITDAPVACAVEVIQSSAILCTLPSGHAGGHENRS